jgi:hypothetical protein
MIIIQVLSNVLLVGIVVKHVSLLTLTAQAVIQIIKDIMILQLALVRV